MDDKRQLIAKFPCSNAGPPHYTTASEVATLEFSMYPVLHVLHLQRPDFRSRTSIRVPKVLDWDSNSANPIGAEYIFLEKVNGVPLSEKWNFASDVDQCKIIDRVVEMEMELAGLHFPAYGSLYLRDSLPHGSSHCLLDSSLDPSGSFCIGPSWTTLTAFAIAKVDQEISRARFHQHDELDPKHHQSLEEHIRLLEYTKRLIPTLASHPMIARSSSSILWHIDLHLGNIFVSNDDSTIIEGIIDWQSCPVSPMFLQCRVPAFLKRPNDYVKGNNAPELPEDFDRLDTIQQQRAILEKSLATRWKMYEMYTFIKNEEAYNALEVDRRLWEPFARCGEWSGYSSVPLRSCLIRVLNDWGRLAFAGECPYTFTKTDLRKHEEELKQHQDRVYLQALARDQLSTNDEGWVPIPEWDSVRAENQDLLDMFVDTMADEMSKEDAMKMWPFYEEASLET
ncbi:hypothetical protein MMC22_002671 [Lobaria immixta]|nr:hypothetical protein [Lobaria immixta]